MNNTLKVWGFIITVVALIAGFASLIPQLESPAPEVLEISGDLSGAELADLGKQILESPEAACLACHGLGREGLRAPDLAGIGARAADIVAGQSAEEYIHESIVNPCTFVVDGFDCIMPTTLLQTLGAAKVTALTAFLQSQGGEVTVSLSADDVAAPPEGDAGGSGVAGTTAEEIIAAAGCAACHQIDAVGAEGMLGPNLSSVAARLSADEIRQSILTPDAIIADECPNGPCDAGIMPKDLGNRLNGTQLETLVAFLSNLN